MQELLHSNQTLAQTNRCKANSTIRNRLRLPKTARLTYRHESPTPSPAWGIAGKIGERKAKLNSVNLNDANRS